MNVENDSARWRRLSELIDELIELSPEDQEVRLERLRSENSSIVTELEELLAADKKSGLLDVNRAEYLATLIDEIESSFPETPPSAAGPYRLIREIGRGGMGVVYLAERQDGQFEQRVALKLVKRGLGPEESLTRFLRERQILARLEHPAIARLLDGGVTDEGQPYFAMEYVEGETITDSCDKRNLSIDGRLGIFHEVCEAVRYAQRNLVMHLDIKPANVLVAEDGSVKLLDFGIAKLLKDEESAAATLTHSGTRPLTPTHAAPEQIRGEPVTTATDTYALGVILYELLTGKRPYGVGDIPRSKIEQAALEVTPSRPSSAVAKRAGSEVNAEKIALARGLTPARLSRRLEGDLDAIVLKSLRKEPGRRYPSAELLAQDIKDHLLGRPVAAQPDSVTYRATKFIRRHRAGVGATCIVVASLVAGLAGTQWQARQKAAEARKAENVKDFLVDIFKASDPAETRGAETTAREILDRGAERIETELAEEPAVQLELFQALGESYQSLGLYEETLAFADRSLALARGLYGNDSPALAPGLHLRGAALTGMGEFEKAEPPLRNAVDRFRKANRGEELAESLDRLGIVLSETSQLNEAEPIMRESLDVRSSSRGKRDPKVAESLNNLGFLMRRLGNYDEAERRYTEAIAIWRELNDSRHPEAVNTLNNLAALMLFLGRPLEARQRFEELQTVLRDLYGADHPRVIAGANNLAVAYVQLAEYEAAEQLLSEVIDHWKREGSIEHPNAMITRITRATLRHRQGGLDEAEAAFRQLLELWSAKVGAEHPVTAVIQSRLGAVLRDRGAYEEAETFHEGSLALKTSLQGDEHPAVAEELHQLGMLALHRDRIDESVTTLRDALGKRRAVLRPGHLHIAETLLALGRALRTKGDLAEAEEVLRKAEAHFDETLPKDHPSAASAKMELGRVLARHGDLEGAVQLVTKATDSMRVRFGDRSWQAAELDVQRAAFEIEIGQSEEASVRLASARDTLVQILGPEHRLSREAERLLGLTTP